MNMPNPAAQPRNPLHGLTLETIVTQLADHYGWHELGTLIPTPRALTHRADLTEVRCTTDKRF
jgi:hypothetical protein